MNRNLLMNTLLIIIVLMWNRKTLSWTHGQ